MSKQKPVVFDDDNPEWTEADFARARPASEILPAHIVDLLVRKPGRPAMAEDDRKQKVNIRLSPDVLEALRAGGAGGRRGLMNCCGKGCAWLRDRLRI